MKHLGKHVALKFHHIRKSWKREYSYKALDGTFSSSQNHVDISPGKAFINVIFMCYFFQNLFCISFFRLVVFLSLETFQFCLFDWLSGSASNYHVEDAVRSILSLTLIAWIWLHSKVDFRIFHLHYFTVFSVHIFHIFG